MAHGYVRTTEDLDLLVSVGRRVGFSELLCDLGMRVRNEAKTFLQFDPGCEGGMNVDVMFVTQEVFERLEGAALKTEIDGAPVNVASLLHLIALKCHALHHSKSIRRLKDMDDIIHLVLINRLDLNQGELRATILKHGSPEIYEKLRHACANE